MLRDNRKRLLCQCRPVQSIFDIPDADSFFFDMYGVLWNGISLYDHVADVLLQLRKQKKKVYILSNQTVVREYFIQNRAKQGLIIGTHYDDVIPSGEVCLDALKNGLLEQLAGHLNYRLYQVGLHNQALFQSFESYLTDDIHQADMIYIGSLPAESKYQLDAKLMNILTEALERKLPAICANPDVYVMSGTEKCYAQGAAARWYELQGGSVVWFGKPDIKTYQYALKQTESEIDTSIMVGDMLATDIYGANRIGMRSVLVTETGISGFDMRTQKLNIREFIQQCAQSDQIPVSDFMPTYIMPCVGIERSKIDR